VSAERTFDHDLDDPAELERQVLKLAEGVGRRLRTAGLAGRTVTLKVRFDTFETVTRSATLPEPTDRTHDILTVARELLARLRLERARVRLLGVGVGNLGDGDGARQLSLDDEAGDRDLPAVLGDPRWERVERVADAVAERFAGLGVSYAALLDARRPRRRGPAPRGPAGRR
jgi:DNA polymerase IV